MTRKRIASAFDPAQIENIAPRDYYATVQRELAKVKKSITVCMYLFTFRPNQSTSLVFQLTESLKKAHNAGIRFEVILDQNINFLEWEDRTSDLSEGKNAVENLKFHEPRCREIVQRKSRSPIGARGGTAT